MDLQDEKLFGLHQNVHTIGLLVKLLLEKHVLIHSHKKRCDCLVFQLES